MVDSELFRIILLCVLSSALTGVICHNSVRIGRATNLMDKPDGVLKRHKTETPVIGGLAALIPTFAVILFYRELLPLSSVMLIAVSASTAMLVVGIIDDRANLSPMWRLLVLAFIVFAVFFVKPLFVLHSLPIRLFGSKFLVVLNDLIAAPITAIFILGFVNAANMADGINGQMLGSVAIWSAFIAYYLGIDIGLPFVVLTCSALIAFFYNLRGRLFTGNSGAYAASLFLALGAIMAFRLTNGKLPAEVPVFWFWLPVVDCVRLMVTRMRSGTSPFLGDRNHFHHVLINHMRLSYALPIYLGLLAAPGAAAILSPTLGSQVLLACIACYAAIITVLKRIALERTKSAPSMYPVSAIFNAEASRIFPAFRFKSARSGVKGVNALPRDHAKRSARRWS